MKKWILLLALAQSCIAFADNSALWAPVSWMAGCWAGTKSQSQEQWMEPAGGVMLGMSRTLRAGKPADFEFMRIVEENGKLFFIAKPSNQPEARFALVTSSSLEAVFENSEHDFPQRVIYRLQMDGTLLARIEGKSEGRDHAIEFPMKRTECAGVAPVCAAQ